MMQEDQQTALVFFSHLLGMIGSANDAEDHGYTSEANRIRGESCEAIRALAADHAFLVVMFPTFRQEIDSQHILGFGWSDLLNQVENQLASILKGQENE